MILPFSCSGQFAYSESLLIYLGRSLDLVRVVLSQLRLRSFLVLACTSFSKSAVSSKGHNLRLIAEI